MNKNLQELQGVGEQEQTSTHQEASAIERPGTQPLQAVKNEQKALRFQNLEQARVGTVGEYGDAQKKMNEIRIEGMLSARGIKEKGTAGVVLEKFGKGLRKVLGLAGFVAVISGGAELSKLTRLSAEASTINKPDTAIESVDQKDSARLQAFNTYKESLLASSGEARQTSIDHLADIAKKHPQLFASLLEQSYQSFNQEVYKQHDGRTLSVDWALPQTDMVRALQDTTFGKENAEELMQTILDRSHDITLGFSEKNQIVLREYPSQAYNDTLEPERGGQLLRRDLIFQTTISGQDTVLRGVIGYNKGKPTRFFLEGNIKNGDPFQSDSIHKGSDERIQYLSKEFKDEFSAYEKSSIGARTFSEYASTGRELVRQLHVLSECERQGLFDEAQVVAVTIADTIHHIEKSDDAQKSEGAGFFDYSQFPERVRQTLDQTTPQSFERTKEVFETRGSMVRAQFERTFREEAEKLMQSKKE